MSKDTDKDFKKKQKELTELNADGNEERGREGEDLSLSKEEEEKLKEKIKELRKRDPYIYRWVRF